MQKQVRRAAANNMSVPIAELEKAIENGATNDECKEHCIHARKCAFNVFGINWQNCKEATEWDEINVYDE